MLFFARNWLEEEHVDEMNADYRSQITDCTRALTRLEGERPCSHRPITLNDSTQRCNLRGPRGRHQNTSDEQSDNLMPPAGCNGCYVATTAHSKKDSCIELQNYSRSAASCCPRVHIFDKHLLLPKERRWRAKKGGGTAWSGLNTDFISLIATERISIRPGSAGDHQHYRNPPTEKRKA